jgi:putative ABC transport system permease protein
MNFFAHVPLAWCNLVHDKRRCAVCVAGVACAVVLMFMQLGFWNALLDSSVQLIQRLNADVVLLSKARYYLSIRERFSVNRLEQAKAVPGVLVAYPLYLEPYGILWRDTSNGPLRFLAGEPSARPIRVIAFNPDYPAVRDTEVQDQLGLLRLPGRVLMDRLSRPAYGERGAGLTRELANHEVHIVGTFALGTDFTCDGSLIMSDETYADLVVDQTAPLPPLALTDVGLIKVAPNASPAQVRDRLNELLPEDVVALTLDEVASLERLFWRVTTPVGLIFTIGLVMGFIVGAVICFQILSADVADHLKEYATLKAIGYRSGYLYVVILMEALWLTLLGYAPALLLTELLYGILGSFTGLPLFLTLPRCALVLVLTACMCTLSGLLAVQKIRTADPAEVF